MTAQARTDATRLAQMAREGAHHPRTLQETNMTVAASDPTDVPSSGPQDRHPEAGRAPWSCRCGRRWRSLAQAHCSTCHEHFGTYGLSDRHQTFGPDREPTCHHPANVRTKGGKQVYRLSEEADGPVWRSYERRDMTNPE